MLKVLALLVVLTYVDVVYSAANDLPTITEPLKGTGGVTSPEELDSDPVVRHALYHNIRVRRPRPSLDSIYSRTMAIGAISGGGWGLGALMGARYDRDVIQAKLHRTCSEQGNRFGYVADIWTTKKSKYCGDEGRLMKDCHEYWKAAQEKAFNVFWQAPENDELMCPSRQPPHAIPLWRATAGGHRAHVAWMRNENCFAGWNMQHLKKIESCEWPTPIFSANVWYRAQRAGSTAHPEGTGGTVSFNYGGIDIYADNGNDPIDQDPLTTRFIDYSIPPSKHRIQYIRLVGEEKRKFPFSLAQQLEFTGSAWAQAAATGRGSCSYPLKILSEEPRHQVKFLAERANRPNYVEELRLGDSGAYTNLAFHTLNGIDGIDVVFLFDLGDNAECKQYDEIGNDRTAGARRCTDMWTYELKRSLLFHYGLHITHEWASLNGEAWCGSDGLNSEGEVSAPRPCGLSDFDGDVYTDWFDLLFVKFDIPVDYEAPAGTDVDSIRGKTFYYFPMRALWPRPADNVGANFGLSEYIGDLFPTVGGNDRNSVFGLGPQYMPNFFYCGNYANLRQDFSDFFDRRTGGIKGDKRKLDGRESDLTLFEYQDAYRTFLKFAFKVAGFTVADRVEPDVEDVEYDRPLEYDMFQGGVAGAGGADFGFPEPGVRVPTCPDKNIGVLLSGGGVRASVLSMVIMEVLQDYEYTPLGWQGEIGVAPASSWQNVGGAGAIPDAAWRDNEIVDDDTMRFSTVSKKSKAKHTPRRQTTKRKTRKKSSNNNVDVLMYLLYVQNESKWRSWRELGKKIRGLSSAALSSSSSSSKSKSRPTSASSKSRSKKYDRRSRFVESMGSSRRRHSPSDRKHRSKRSSKPGYLASTVSSRRHSVKPGEKDVKPFPPPYTRKQLQNRKLARDLSGKINRLVKRFMVKHTSEFKEAVRSVRMKMKSFKSPKRRPLKAATPKHKCRAGTCATIEAKYKPPPEDQDETSGASSKKQSSGELPRQSKRHSHVRSNTLAQEVRKSLNINEIK